MEEEDKQKVKKKARRRPKEEGQEGRRRLEEEGQEERTARLSKYSCGDALYLRGKFYGFIEKTASPHYYGIRTPNFIGIILVLRTLIDCDPDYSVGPADEFALLVKNWD